MRFSLAALLLLIAIVAASFATIKVFWIAKETNYSLLLGIFLLAVCLTSVSALFGNHKFRPAFAGASLFGIAYLVCVLKGGFGLVTIYDAQAIAKNTIMGFPLLGIALLASHWLAMIATPPADKQDRGNGEPPGVL